MIIGLVGPKLAGKGTIAAYLKQNHQAEVYSMSGVLVDVATRLHLELSRENLIAVATGLRHTLGTDIIAQVLQKDILAANDKLAVVDGIRFADEIAYFEQLPDFHLIYIDAEIRQRYERALQRGEKAGESDMSFEQFEKEEVAVTEAGITKLQNNAELTIDNNNSFEELYEKVEQALLKIND